MAYVYRHIRLDKNEPFYIGIGGVINEDNFLRAYKRRNRNKIWKSIVNKSEIRVEILQSDITPELAKDQEKFFISLYGRIDHKNGSLANLTDGGDGCRNMKHSNETKINHSKRISGVNHPNYGKTISDNTKKLIAEKLNGRKNQAHSIKMKGNTNSAKGVISTNGIFYSSCREAANKLNMNYSTLRAMLNGSNPNKTNLKYALRR